MKTMLFVSILLSSIVAHADFSEITEKLGADHAIVKQCQANGAKVVSQIATNESIIARSQATLSGIIKDVSEVNSRAQVQENLELAQAESLRLKTEPVSVTLVSVAINSEAVLKLDVNCQTAKVEATLRTFVTVAEVQRPNVTGLDISQDDILNPIAHIQLSRMFVPANGNLIQSSNFILSIDAQDALSLTAIGLESAVVGLQADAYIFDMPASSRVSALQTLIGIPAN